MIKAEDVKRTYVNGDQKVEALRDEALPVITVIPAVAGSRGIGQEEIRALVEKAVGADIMSR